MRLWLAKKHGKNLAVFDGRRQRSQRLLQALVTTLVLSNGLTPVASANVLGIDAQNFNPTTSGLDFVTVHSSETLEPGVLNFSFFLNYAINTLPFFDETAQGYSDVTDSMLGGDFSVGLGLLPNLDVGLSFPQLLHQEVRSDGYRGQFQRNGQTEIRANAKFRLFGDREGGMAVVGSTNINRVENNPYVGSSTQPTANAELVADTTIKNLALGLNLGYRFRQPGEKVDQESPIDPVGDQYIGSVAASYHFTSIDTKLIFEVFGSSPVNSETENSRRLASSAEALLGLKHDFTTHLAGHMGVGREITHGRSSPDFRVYAGLGYVLGPTFGEKKPAKVVSQQAKVGPVAAASVFDVAPKAKEKFVIHDVLFEFDSSDVLVGSSEDTLRKLVEHINKKPGFDKLIIEGHTDSIGTDNYNLKLSQKRSQTIKRILIEKMGVQPSKVMAVGRGERAPIADNGNYQGRQLNRRVEFTIYRPAH
jgi:outer membrane protein OmpA-like peptidoglycan-associated protein